ncbi:hypothetical protein [Sphingobacterium pedocola]|uniref:Transcription regulator BetR N-terminal domain-containing protein n=1 Tax=Sphingobacterium pedocola TaxID=2082722 RepID=A0ABR9T9Q0_9SPHI|nr:hypothetical protein [Sphingobacterium pedocola]MBE8721357.1 hypothetical protein [Sphingobacterium pedocola]
MKEEKKKYQRNLFQSLEKVIGSHVYKELEGLLFMSYKSVYSLRQGNSWLKFEDAAKIIEHFGLPVQDLFVNKTGLLGFSYISLKDFREKGYREYLNRLAVSIRLFAKKIRAEMLFLADEIPIFHFMPHKELIYFKLFTWAMENQTDRERPLMFYEDFVKDMEEMDFTAEFESIYAAYMEIPSQEIWSPSTIDSMLYELQLYIEYKVFREKEVIGLLHDQVAQIWKNQLDWVSTRRKPNGQYFDLFYTRTHIGGGRMLLKSDEDSTAVIKLHKINSIATSDRSFVQEQEASFRSITEKSSLLGTAPLPKLQLIDQEIRQRIELSNDIAHKLYIQTYD